MKEAMNCWDFFKCSEDNRQSCCAYIQNSGRNCWDLAGSETDWPCCPNVEKEYDSCLDCPWFQKLNPGVKGFN